MYNKKQIKEEAYKLEDLENSKAFIIDRARNNLISETIAFAVLRT